MIGGQGLAKQLGNIKHTRLWFFFLETDQADKIVKNEKWATLGLKMEIAYAMEKQGADISNPSLRVRHHPSNISRLRSQSGTTVRVVHAYGMYSVCITTHKQPMISLHTILAPNQSIWLSHVTYFFLQRWIENWRHLALQRGLYVYPVLMPSWTLRVPARRGKHFLPSSFIPTALPIRS